MEADFHTAVRQGDMLIELKSQCKHGEWSELMRDRLMVDRSQATKYMRLAENKLRLSNSLCPMNLGVGAAIKLINKQLKQEAISK